MAEALTRRQFIHGAAAGTVVVALEGCASLGGQNPLPAPSNEEALWLIATGKRVPERYRIEHSWWPISSDQIPSRWEDGFLPVTARLRVRRAVDLVDLTFQWTNVSFTAHGTGVVKNRGVPAYLSVIFPPQHVIEQYVGDPPEVDRVAGMFSGGTRLVFSIPEIFETTPLPLTLATLFDWSKLIPSVVPHAQPYRPQAGIQFVPRAPTEFETAIEVPWGMLLSPDAGEAWQLHSDVGLKPLAGQRLGRVELWHARLFRPPPTPDAVPDPTTVRAIWARWPNPSDKTLAPLPAQDPGASPQYTHREDLVHETSNFKLDVHSWPSSPRHPARTGPYIPRAVLVDRLMLSGQGSYAKLKVGWNWDEFPTFKKINSFDPEHLSGPPGLVVDEWKQETIWGRDQYVLVSEAGNVLPFGHAVSLVQIYKREFAEGSNSAVLRQYYYCTVRQPVMEYPWPDEAAAVIGRGMCFQRVEISPHETPYLNPPPAGSLYFEMTRLGTTQIFEFTITAWDWENRRCTFKLPLIWAKRTEIARDLFAYGKELDHYCTEVPLRTASLNGQKISFTRPLNAGPTTPDASVTVKSITFKVDEMWDEAAAWINDSTGKPVRVRTPQTLRPPKDWILPFYPAVDVATVQLHQTAAFDQAGAATLPLLSYNPHYLQGGFAPAINGNQVYADIAGANVKFREDMSGALATPSLAVRGLSRIFGPVGGGMTGTPVMTKSGGAKLEFRFDPNAFFAAAWLLGAVQLERVIEPLAEAYKEIEKVPKLISEVIEKARAIYDQLKAPLDQLQAIVDLVTHLPREWEVVKKLVETQLTSFASEAKRKALATLIEGSETALTEIMTLLAAEVTRICGNVITDARHDRFVKNLQAAVNCAAVAAEVSVAWRDLQNVEAELIRAIAEFASDVTAAEFALVQQRLDAYFQDQANQVLAKITSVYVGVGDFRRHVLADLRAAGATAEEMADLVRDFELTLVEAPLLQWWGGVNAAVDAYHDFPLGPIRRIGERVRQLHVDPKDPEAIVGAIHDVIDAVDSELNRLLPELGGGVLRSENESLKAKKDGLLNAARTDVDGVGFALTTLRDQVNQRIQASAGALALTRTQLQAEFDDFVKNQQDRLVGLVQQRKADLQQEVATLAAALSDTATQLKNALQQLAPVAEAALRPLRTVIKAVRDIEKAIDELPKELHLAYNWSPGMVSSGAFVAFRNGERATFTLNVDIRQSLVPKGGMPAPTTRINARLANFELRLLPTLPFLRIQFREVTFLSVNGSAPDVNVKIASVKFEEKLEFVKKLAAFLSPGPNFILRLVEEGLEAGYRFHLPAVTTGGLNFFNLSFNCSLILPFKGGPMLTRFSISDRQQPFFITVTVFGGAGFFGLVARPDYVEKIEGSLEFGAAVGLDLGPAQGTVSVTVGAYFSMSGNDASLFGFERAYGNLDVLGLISITAEFYVGLGYERRGGRSYMVGEAVLTVEIEILFSSISVDIHYRKEYEGSGDKEDQDPSKLLSVAAGSPRQGRQDFAAVATRWKTRRARRINWDATPAEDLVNVTP